MDTLHLRSDTLNLSVEKAGNAARTMRTDEGVESRTNLGDGRFKPAPRMLAKMPKGRAAKVQGAPPAVQKAERVPLAQVLAALRERVEVLYTALGLPENARPGERGTVGELSEAVLKIQDYLLRTSERMNNILETLKNHRELLVKMNQRIFHVGTRERIRIELDIMKNTASVLALNGVELDETLLPDIHRLRESAEKGDVDVAALRKAKENLDKKFEGEIRKVDPAALYRARTKEVAGYG